MNLQHDNVVNILRILFGILQHCKEISAIILQSF